MSIKTTKRLALGVIASLVFAPFAAIAPASAATGDLDGKVICTTSTTELNVTTVAASTATTAATPHTFTAVGGSAFECTVTQSTDYEAVEANAFSLADFTTDSTAWTDETVAGAASSTDTTGLGAIYGATAPATAGTYYLRIQDADGGTFAYVKLVVVNALAYLGDGLDALAGTATAASFGKTTVTGVAGPANSVTVNVLKNANAGKRGVVTVSGAGATISTGGTVAPNFLSTTVAADGLGTQAVVVKTPTAGTVTVNYYPETTAGGGIFSTTATTVTVTVNAAAITGVYTSSTAYMNTSTTDPTATSDATTTTTAPLAASTASDTPMANIKVTQLDGQATAVAVPTANTKAVVYEISGAGALGTANNARQGSYIAVAAASANNNVVYIYPDGRAGVGTITVKVNGVLVSTKTVKFHSAVASYTLVTKNAVLAVGSTADTQVLTVQALDANGVAIPSHTVYVSSGTTTVATVDAASVTTSSAGVAADIGVNGVAKGSAVITVANSASSTATGYVSATATISVVAAGVSSVALSFDKTSYLPGEKATLSITLKNADAALVGDQEYANLFATGGITASASLTTIMTAVAATTVSGVKTFTVYMPLTEGPVSVEGTLGASVVTALQATKVSASTTVAKPVVPVVVPPVVYDNPTLSFVKSNGRIILSGTAVDGEGDIIIYVKKVGTTAWKERAKTLEVAAPGDFNGSIKAPKANVLMRVKQEGTGQFSNQIIVVK